MLVTVLGAAGRTGRLIVDELLAHGHDVRACVRREEQLTRLRELGVAGVLMDLTGDGARLTEAMTGSDAVINAAAASSPEPGLADAVDRDAALACVRSAEGAGVTRFVQISSMFADRPDQGPPFLRGVLRAKQVADRALEESRLVSTVVRPAGLVDEPCTGGIRVGEHLTSATIPRADVATVGVACLAVAATENRAFDVHSGRTAVAAALGGLRVR